ncbi:hypothetical protein GDO78_021507 [Eleutherodactylus coqui]|uniref:Secreted protein n=1 Tax=Eleutherodactylus coqui TaxID=57060 RepID=A0A8J6EC94_ELECQ|nr:hypothetical protein GDO78_021507 [Eleutherodactylus coqui]
MSRASESCAVTLLVTLTVRCLMSYIHFHRVNSFPNVRWWLHMDSIEFCDIANILFTIKNGFPKMPITHRQLSNSWGFGSSSTVTTFEFFFS